MKQTYYSNGKLLLTGEYVVLDGALSLAVPTQFGQSLIVESIQEPKLIWKSYDSDNSVWFEDEFDLKQIVSGYSNLSNDISERLIQVLIEAKQLNPNFLSEHHGFKVESKLTFPRIWGLGTSSTLINNVATWAEVDAYQLLERTFGGSGYDIACAQYDSAITYQLKEPFKCSIRDKRTVSPVNFNPKFKSNLYFVHLNKKQDTRVGIENYKKHAFNLSKEIFEINGITSNFLVCKQLEEFETLINQHELIISKITRQQPVKELHFKDFEGSIKSLGAWGGDFVMVASKENPTSYFKSKGFETVIPFEQMILEK